MKTWKADPRESSRFRIRPVTTRRRPDSHVACVSFPAEVKEIPGTIDEVVFDNEIPDDARKFDPPVELASNVELVASVLPETAEEGGLLHLATWWRVTGSVERHIMPAFHICPGGETPRRGTPWYTRHDAGDWAVPLARLKPGTIVDDRYPARLAGLPTGKAKVYAAVLDAAKPNGGRICGEPQLLGEVEIVPAKRGQDRFASRMSDLTSSESSRRRHSQVQVFPEATHHHELQPDPCARLRPSMFPTTRPRSARRAT